MATWIFGPQLIGVVFFIIGLITLCFPPKHINRFYGYRLPSAMKNQQTWTEANRYATRFMLKAGVWIFITGILFTLTLRLLPVSFSIKEALTLFSFILSGIVPAVFSIVATERHLNKTFNKTQDEIY